MVFRTFPPGGANRRVVPLRAPAGVRLMTLNQVEENLLIEVATASGGVAKH